MRNMNRNLIALVLVGLVLQGCAMFKSSYGPHSTAYSAGTLHAMYDDTLFRTYDASRAALQDMGMNITNMQRNPTEGRIDAVMKDGTDVHLFMNAERPDLTAVDIKIGQYGIEETSRKISEKIGSSLKG